MFQKTFDKLQTETSSDRAMHYLREVTRFHRIQVSEGFRQAAEYVHQACEEFGLQSEILTYPADGKSTTWGQPPLQKEWWIKRATLKLVSPSGEEKKLADYQESKLSVIQRCGATPAGGITAEVVAVPQANRKESYEEIDVEGKFVLIDTSPDRVYRLAVVQRNAAGIITDQMPTFPPVRQEMDLPDALAYRSFWYQSDDEPCPGFVLSPREGAQLRKLLEKSDEPVEVRAEVEAGLTEGTMEVVSAFIPGTEDTEEVLVAAHLCHPQPSANDNASGVSAAMEAARALRHLIDDGQLPAPRRGIRFLFIPEMAGTYAFLAENEDSLDRYTAGINLDMVGSRQDICGGSLSAEQPPLAAAGFSGELAALILQHAANDSSNLAKTAKYASFRHAVTPFSGGSDHYILSDPTVGIPSPMLIQWPDRFYHTSQDTVDKIDPTMLARVATITATYAHFAAAADRSEALWLAGEMTFRFANTLAQVRDRVWEYIRKRDTDEAICYLKFLAQRRICDVQSLVGLGLPEDSVPQWEEEIDRQLQQQIRVIRRLSEADAVPPGSDAASSEEDAEGEEKETDEGKLRNTVFSRVHPGPISLRRRLSELPEQKQKKWAEIQKEDRFRSVAFTLAIYWTDGQRSLAEIRDLVRWECGVDLTEVIDFFYESLEKLQLVKRQ